MSSLATVIPHFVNGERVEPTSGRFADVFDPSTGKVQSQVPLASKAEVDAAIAFAETAQPAWAATNPQKRARILTRFVELPEAPQTVYPGEIWLCFQVPDVEESIATVEANGGSCRRPGENRPEHQVRAAVVCDMEGHVIELVGPMKG